jgi:hypothetical protein
MKWIPGATRQPPKHFDSNWVGSEQSTSGQELRNYCSWSIATLRIQWRLQYHKMASEQDPPSASAQPQRQPQPQDADTEMSDHQQPPAPHAQPDHSAAAAADETENTPQNQQAEDQPQEQPQPPNQNQTQEPQEKQPPPPPPAPGPRAARLQALFASTAKHTLDKINKENFGACFPTISDKAPGTLEFVQRQMVERLGGLWNVRLFIPKFYPSLFSLGVEGGG